MRKVLAILGISALITMAASPAAAQANTWSANVRITSIEVSNVNLTGIWLQFSAAPLNHHCSVKNGQWLLGGGTATAAQMASYAGLALVNSRNVTVFWGGTCSGGGTTGYPILLGITFK